MRTSVLLAAFALPLAAAGGCGGPPRAEVKGAVSLDGKPVESGIIQFSPADGAGVTGASPIIGGRYEKLVSSVGKMKVSILSTDVVGKRKRYDTPDSPVDEIVENRVPDEYNVKTKLEVDVDAGPNERNFDLVGGKKAK